jgi:hypothetical protein
VNGRPDRPDLPDLPAFCSKQDLEALGLGRRAVDALVRALPHVAIPGVRRVYLRRADVERYLADHTYSNDRVRPP